jgi:hypothetical protein
MFSFENKICFFKHFLRVEIWTNETLNTTLKQVQFYWYCDLFENKEQAIMVLADIRTMLDQIHEDCENTTNLDSSLNAQYSLYNSEVMIGNNCVLIMPGDSKIEERVFLGYNTFNTISTYNLGFIKETSLWMNNLVKKSLLISGSTEKQRTIFFKSMETRIDLLEAHIYKS